LYAAQNDPTPEFNIDVTMRAFLGAGAPADKLLLGIPFYGRGYGGVPPDDHGLFQETTARPANWSGSDGDWKVLSKTRLTNPEYVRHWDSSSRVPWLYDSTSGTWVTYDDPQSIGEKVRYVRDHKLGGVMIWELGGDDGSLMRAISAHN
jgi:chitinase